MTDYCEWLKNSSFLTYVGPDYAWGENLACYGTHLGVHHALLHRPPDRKAFHTQDVDPHLYSGVPFVVQITDLEIKVGNPLGTVGIFAEGEILLGRVLKSSTHQFTIDFYPHQMITTLSVKGWEIETRLTYTDAYTIFAHVKITNHGESKRDFSPLVSGRLEPGMQGYGTRSGEHLSIDFAPIGGYHHTFVRIHPSFEIKGWGFSTEGLVDASVRAASKAGEGRFTWASRPLFYGICGLEQHLNPGESVHFNLLLAISRNKEKAEAGVKANRDPEEVERAARSWYNTYFAKLKEPPKDLSEAERKYYYGSAWVQRHNQCEPMNQFKYDHWLHSRGFYGWYGDRLFTGDVPFLTLQLGEIDPALAKSEFLNMVERQAENGMIGNIGSTSIGRVHGVSTLSSFAALALFERDGDKEFIEKIYTPLRRFHAWWFKERDSSGEGIVEFRDSLESGHDNNVVYMDMLGPVEAVDINCYLYVDGLSLARMADILGDKNEAKAAQEEASRHKQRIIDHFYDKESGLLWNKTIHGGEFIRIKSFHSTITPLWAGIVPPEAAKMIIEKHILNPEEFFTTFPFPDVPRDEFYYSSGRHTGTTWLTLDLLVLQALAYYGYRDQAEVARRKIIENVSRSRRFWQYWDPEGGGFEFREMGPDHRVANCAWTAAAFTEIVLRRYEDLSDLLKRISQPI